MGSPKKDKDLPNATLMSLRQENERLPTAGWKGVKVQVQLEAEDPDAGMPLSCAKISDSVR